MDIETAVLVAIALTCSLQLQNHPPKISSDWLAELPYRPVLCTDVEMGMPCSDPLLPHAQGG